MGMESEHARVTRIGAHVKEAQVANLFRSSHYGVNQIMALEREATELY